MRIVEDSAGNRHLLVQQSGESSLVRAVDTGERRTLPTADLTTVSGTSPLETAAAMLPDAARRLITATHDVRALGFLVALETADGLPVRDVLDAEDYCESDLHGLVSEFRAAGLVVETTVDGQPGYRLTDDASTVVRALQSASASG